MYAEIERLAAAGVYHFFSGMALGVDLWASQMVLDLRSTYPNLILHCILPCERQEVKWPEKKQEVYRDILRKADSIEYISQEYYNGCMLDRNRKLVSSSEILLAVYNGEQRGGTAATVRYARQAGREIIIIDEADCSHPLWREFSWRENSYQHKKAAICHTIAQKPLANTVC